MTTNSELSADEKKFEEWAIENECGPYSDALKEPWLAACAFKNAEIEKLEKKIIYLEHNQQNALLFQNSQKEEIENLQAILTTYKDGYHIHLENWNKAIREVKDLHCLINEVLLEAYQDHPAEAKLSLGIIKEKLLPFQSGKMPYSIQRGLQNEIEKLATLADRLRAERDEWRNTFINTKEETVKLRGEVFELRAELAKEKAISEKLQALKRLAITKSEICDKKIDIIHEHQKFIFWEDYLNEIDKLEKELSLKDHLNAYNVEVNKKLVEKKIEQDKEIEKLRADLEKLQSFTGVTITSTGFHGWELVDELAQTKNELAKEKAISEKLQAISEKLEKACEFYGHAGSWSSIRQISRDDINEAYIQECGPFSVGGKLARQTLKEVKEMRG